jgi:hypothetical protein
MTPSAASGCTGGGALSASGSRSVLTASGASSDLWAQALQRLPTGDRAKLNSDPSVAAWAQGRTGSETLPDLLEQLHDLAKRNKKQYDTKSWSFKLHGRDYILRDVAGKVVEWVNLFKQVGDVAIQHDPGYAALPWAGVRFLLEVGEHKYSLMPARPLRTLYHADLLYRFHLESESCPRLTRT